MTVSATTIVTPLQYINGGENGVAAVAELDEDEVGYQVGRVAEIKGMV